MLLTTSPGLQELGGKPLRRFSRLIKLWTRKISKISSFRKKHIPTGLIERKKDEFRRRRKGSKDVVGYLDEFTELSRYAPDGTDTKVKKIERFMNGLHDEM